MATAFPPPPIMPFVHPDDMPQLYAIRGVGRCMEPVINDGALLTFDKEQAPEPGDVVGLVFSHAYAQRWGAPGCVKKLKMALPPPIFSRAFAGLVVVEQINPPRTYTFRTSDVLAVHKCVGLAEPDPDNEGRARFRLKQEAPRC